MSNDYTSLFLKQADIKAPIICGPMYPCSNPELVAAASNAGAIGIFQPVTLTYVNNYEFREGIRYIRQLTDNPIGMNALIESSSKKYYEKMIRWVNIALEEGVRFFITSLGNPTQIVNLVHTQNGYVYHDVTERKWAQKGADAGVDGFIAVNNLAGGHAGNLSPQQLYEELIEFDLPVVSAGGISSPEAYVEALDLGFSGIQMGTRFIASHECSASGDYKQAIINATKSDIVLTEKITGVPVSVINTGHIKKLGTKPGAIMSLLLKNNRTKHLIRLFYLLRSVPQLKRALFTSEDDNPFWQAGKSVEGISQIESTQTIIESFEAERKTLLNQ